MWKAIQGAHDPASRLQNGGRIATSCVRTCMCFSGNFLRGGRHLSIYDAYSRIVGADGRTFPLYVNFFQHLKFNYWLELLLNKSSKSETFAHEKRPACK